ncbi:transcription regulator protein [Herbaspirillum rubrisubalbicans M1]|uniref:helix-turn-helix transcriptional regulator n=1 Tax=Herbaspirillum rubrisubalbicans TaxID=80842 RepID=UPI00073A093F|nr:AraC family transcriptional regulator [Herbaspirillum rubrisubalbicans]ALU88276.1 transcription regulator protein [Herbaspirillum rubrisubalbicans M1]
MPTLTLPPGELPLPQLHLRSYREQTLADRHDFSQLVLPLAGRLELDIAGHQGYADSLTAAFVEPGAWHETRAGGSNRALVLDLAPHAVDTLQLEALARRAFVPLTAAASKLVEFMALSLAQSTAPAAGHALHHWVPLLLDTLAQQPPQVKSRLHRMLARVEAQAAQPWTVADMAALAAISPSRLHEWFQQELGTSPRAWLAEVRLAQACQLLRTSALPVAAIAQRCGYGDQSAMTHAMRKLRGTTPSAYRKQYRA